MFWFVCILVVCYTVAMWYRRSLKLERLEGRHVFITGCDTGFGNLLAKRLDKLGMYVFAGCLTQEGKEQLTQSTSSRLTVLDLDVTNHDSVVKACREVRERIPENKGLWGLVNNAGVTGLTVPIEFLNLEDYKKCNSVNLYGMIDVTTEFLPLVRKENGRIVNITSSQGRFAGTTAPYAVSKFGAEGFSDCLRRELYNIGVTVHILEPGYFNTGIINIEKFKADSAKRFAAVDENIQNFYGPSYLVESWKKVTGMVDILMKFNSVSWVVDAYVHALTAVHPKARYVVGWDAKSIFSFLWTVPEWMSDFLFTRFQAIPAGIKNQH